MSRYTRIISSLFPVSDEERKRKQLQSVDEIHDFVKQLPELQKNKDSLAMHIRVFERMFQTTNSRRFRKHWDMEQNALDRDTRPVVPYIQELWVVYHFSVCACRTVAVLNAFSRLPFPSPARRYPPLLKPALKTRACVSKFHAHTLARTNAHNHAFVRWAASRRGNDCTKSCVSCASCP